jgi:hypothetical protein
MSIQRIPLKAVQKIRQHIRGALVLPDVKYPFSYQGSDREEVPEPKSLDDLSHLFTLGGVANMSASPPQFRKKWFVSIVNPAAALIKLPGLYLKENYRLVAYLYRKEEKGVGVVWAVPEEKSTTEHLEKPLTSCLSIIDIPKPEGALSSFMEAFQGDRSPTSFIVASVLRRELEEFGAIGDSCNWNHHHLIDTVPANITWQWQGNPPKDMLPKVKLLPDGQAAVELFSCRVATPYKLYRHIDLYPIGHYRSTNLDKSVAIAR